MISYVLRCLCREFTRRENVMKILEENIREYRGELGHVVGKQLRIVPEIVFYQDTTLDYAEHIDELLKM